MSLFSSRLYICDSRKLFRLGNYSRLLVWVPEHYGNNIVGNHLLNNLISCSANDFLPINEKDELFQDHYKTHLFWDYMIFLGHQCFVLLSDTYQQVFLIWFPHFLIDFLPIFFLFAIITFALAEIDIICSKTSRWLMVSLTCK